VLSWLNRRDRVRYGRGITVEPNSGVCSQPVMIVPVYTGTAQRMGGASMESVGRWAMYARHRYSRYVCSEEFRLFFSFLLRRCTVRVLSSRQVKYRRYRMVEAWVGGGRGAKGTKRTGSVVDKIIPGTGGHSLGKKKKKNCQSFTNQMRVPEKYHTGE